MRPRVLVVDDEPMVAANLRAFFEDEDMEVHSVGSGEDALRVVCAGAGFHVCVMDLRLPGMDGSQTIAELHKVSPALQFVIHTGSTGYALSKELRAIGITDSQLFVKPVLDMGELAEQVRQLSGR
jgi:CheY-like chemotaxis protein